MQKSTRGSVRAAAVVVLHQIPPASREDGTVGFMVETASNARVYNPKREDRQSRDKPEAGVKEAEPVHPM